ncbi:MAG: hypothetical protein L6V95_10115 [Candidatus Melainabacteria bacterium]|nr:MAG: hypothetical protein L6V95_10115 [Candidatus Melainabacteria bacterium]
MYKSSKTKMLNNISQGVEFILRGAKKRRSMAIAEAKAVNNQNYKLQKKPSYRY